MTIKKVLVNGRNGFIGRHLCKRLKKLGSKLLLLLLIKNFIDVTNVRRENLSGLFTALWNKYSDFASIIYVWS